MNQPSSLPSTVPAATPVAGVPVKWLWAAIGVLGLSVAALATTMAVQWSRQGSAPAVTVATAAQADLAAPRTPESQIITERREEPPAGYKTPAPLQGQPPRPLAAAAPLAAPAPHHAPRQALPTQPVREARSAPVCGVCGRVESVQPVQQAEPATGVGAVAGGVLGAVVGNQFGRGNGRAAATVLGAVGGGYLGNQVEQRTRTHTVYQVRVRMEDGSVRQFTRAQPVAVGTPVTLEGQGFRAAQEPPASYSGQQAPAAVRVADTY